MTAIVVQPGMYRTQETEGTRWEADSGRGYGAGDSQFPVITATGKTDVLITGTTALITTAGAAAADGSLMSTPDVTATSAETDRRGQDGTG